MSDEVRDGWDLHRKLIERESNEREASISALDSAVSALLHQAWERHATYKHSGLFDVCTVRACVGDRELAQAGKDVPRHGQNRWLAQAIATADAAGWLVDVVEMASPGRLRLVDARTGSHFAVEVGGRMLPARFAIPRAEQMIGGRGE